MPIYRVALDVLKTRRRLQQSQITVATDEIDSAPTCFQLLKTDNLVEAVSQKTFTMFSLSFNQHVFTTPGHIIATNTTGKMRHEKSSGAFKSFWD